MKIIINDTIEIDDNLLHEDFIHMTRNEMWPLVQATIYAFRGAISRAFA